MKPEGAMQLTVSADLAEYSFEDASAMIIKAMTDDGIHPDTRMGWLLTTGPWLHGAYQEIVTKFLREANVERNKDPHQGLYVYMESLPKLQHQIDPQIRNMDEWCLTGFGVTMRHKTAKERKFFSRSKETMELIPFQYTVWSAGA